MSLMTSQHLITELLIVSCPTQWFYHVPYLHLFLEFYSEKNSPFLQVSDCAMNVSALHYCIKKLMVMLSLWFTTEVRAHPSSAMSQGERQFNRMFIFHCFDEVLWGSHYYNKCLKPVSRGEGLSRPIVFDVSVREHLTSLLLVQC